MYNREEEKRKDERIKEKKRRDMTGRNDQRRKKREKTDETVKCESSLVFHDIIIFLCSDIFDLFLLDM